MKVIFRINYITRWGESIWICGSRKTLGNWDKHLAFPLTHNGNGEWEATINFKDSKKFEYKFFLKTSSNQIIWEGGSNRIFKIDQYNNVETREYWRPQSNLTSPLFSKVFSDVLMKHKNTSDPEVTPKKAVLFQIRAPRVASNLQLGIVGNCKELGNWVKPLTMYQSEFPFWKKYIDIEKIKFPIAYKYVLINSTTKKIELWEDGEERQIFYVDCKEQSVLHIQSDEDFRYPAEKWKGAGVALPIFSMRTEESFGVGEFNDLKKMVDWAKKVELKMIQVLPINETIATHSWLDSYPYKSISVFALHPMYLNLNKMGELDDEKLRDEFDLAKGMLNAKTFVDYVEVTQFKSKYFKLIFDQTWKQVKRTKAFQNFFNENQEWLKPYAAFCFLRDRYKTSNFREWGVWSTFDVAKIEELVDPKSKHYEHIAIHYFLQYHLDQQLTEAIEYAHQNGIALKGDIPIGISPNSIEAWTDPELFNLNGQAGAPPDDFAVLGQNWGFPTYNWEVMAKDGFAWWRKRLSMMSRYFDAYRIDHILGFFRIWEIPQNAIHGLLGFFKPALPLFLDEIAERGIWFDEERMVKPYIRHHFLHEIFGEHTEEVLKLYLIEKNFHCYTLKDNYNTQRKTYNHFTPADNADELLSEKQVIIRDGLISLLDEVIFIRDPYSSYPAYHPRISMHNSYSYRELDHNTKEKLDALYIDFFYNRHEEFWKNEAMKKLPSIINATNMLVCGEDLGMVPDNVPEVMKALNILSLEIQRMPKNPKIEFAHPNDAPYLSVCTTSTHDMATIRGWWEENRDKTQRFYHYYLGHNNQAPYFAEPWVCTEIINQHLHSPAMWTIFPIQDLLAMDGELRWNETDKERINVPSDEKNKWCYRMILSLESLNDAEQFNNKLREMISRSKRNID